MLVFSWGILASHFLEDAESLKKYHTAFIDIGSLIDKEGKYTPLFFSPVSKKLVQFDELSQQLMQRMERPPQGILQKQDAA